MELWTQEDENKVLKKLSKHGYDDQRMEEFISWMGYVVDNMALLMAVRDDLVEMTLLADDITPVFTLTEEGRNVVHALTTI